MFSLGIGHWRARDFVPQTVVVENLEWLFQLGKSPEFYLR